jgi:stress-induced morphogen
MFRSTLRRLMMPISVDVQSIEAKLMASPVLTPRTVRVKDISGGCGSFYEIYVESSAFAEKPILKQHRMVNEALKEEIPKLHGVTIKTALPK